MRHILLVLIITLYHLGFSETIAQDETYRVIYVQGTILVKGKSRLSPGMDIHKDDQLIFKDPYAQAIVMDSQKGRFRIPEPHPAEVSRNPDQELWAILSQILLPIQKNQGLDTRGMQEAVSSFRKYFGDSTFYVIGEELRFKFDSNHYVFSETQKPILQYTYKDKLVNKLIHLQDNILFLHRAVHFQTQGVPINPNRIQEFNLLLQSGGFLDTLHRFRLKFIEDEALQQTFQFLLEIEKAQIPSNQEDKYKYLLEFFLLSFGKTDERVLKDWLKKNGF